ncbi:MAG: group II intron reverse transcriptase/maturase [Pleurocapsa sp. MO_226.B13]|nr:group II intron reverse transcriptase/maturase [Pleurocapsa sp. MO_226.B13]
MNTVQPMYKWDEIPWRKLERNIYKLQKRIYKASRRGDVKLVRRLQKLLIKSWGAKCLAVRRVTQENQGRKTAGVDGIKNLTPKQRLTLVNKLTLGSKVAPTRRVWIPKPGKEEKRPLGIPTIKDRTLQGLVKLVLEPEWEARFEPNSHGFRPGRSCHDAIEAIFNSIRIQPKYVLDADISKCFDRIDHKQLLRKLNTFPTLRRQIRAWLNAGVVDNDKLFPTSEGTPQGGTLSPLLANIALHGMETYIKEQVGKMVIKDNNDVKISLTKRKQSVSLIRYADDFVILHKDITVVQRCSELISEWLNDMGLELKPSKTRLTHTLNRHKKETPGFNFLGFHVQQFPVGKYNSGTNKGKKLGFKTIITPSQESQKRHYNKLAEVIEKHKSVTQVSLIAHLNPIIRGWCNYFSNAVNSAVFSRLAHLLFLKLYRWGLHRHQNKGKKWVKSKYFHRVGDNNWVFSSRQYDNPFILVSHRDFTSESKTKKDKTSRRFVKVKGDASPYNGDLIYWSSRMGRHPEMPTRTASLLKKQKGKCKWCELIFRENDAIEIDHIIPTAAGGKDEYKNLQLLHGHCHDEKSKSDLKIIDDYQRQKRITELYRWFNKLNWTWKEDIPTMT